MLRKEFPFSARLRQGQNLAAQMFKRYGGLPLTAAVYPAEPLGEVEQKDVVLLIAQTEELTQERKDAFRRKVEEMMESTEAVAVAIIIEAWICSPDAPEKKREALVVTLETPSSSMVSVAFIDRKEDGSPTLHEWETVPSSHAFGNFAGFFPTSQLLN